MTWAGNILKVEIPLLINSFGKLNPSDNFRYKQNTYPQK